MPLDTYNEYSPANPINQNDCIELEPTELDLLSDEIDKLKYELFRSRASAKFWKDSYSKAITGAIELKGLLEVSAPKQDFLINKLTAIIKE